MTIENGADPAANDTATPIANASADQTDAAENTEADDGDETEADGDKQDADDIEIDVDGTKIRIARKVKEAIAKPFQQDYTRKTEEIATQRKTFESERDGWTKSAQALRSEEFKVAAIDEQLTRYKDVDWQALYRADPENYQAHRINYDTLKDQRETADRALSQKRGEFQQQANRESGERVAKAQAEIARHLPEWTPGGELDIKLLKYATDELKIPARELGETALRVPQFVKELNRLRLYDEAAKKQKTSQTFQQTQQAKPVTQVGGNSGTVSRKTTDSSGDKLSTEEWARREQERVASQRAKARR